MYIIVENIIVDWNTMNANFGEAKKSHMSVSIRSDLQFNLKCNFTWNAFIFSEKCLINTKL